MKFVSNKDPMKIKEDLLFTKVIYKRIVTIFHQDFPRKKTLLISIEKFSFKSQHFSGYPFDIKLYVNGLFEVHLFDCCEYRFHRGGFRINRLFLIENIDKSYPCQRFDQFDCFSNHFSFRFNQM